MCIRPGQGKLTKRPLHFIFLLDCSGSMGGDSGKINSLNQAVRGLIPHLQDAAQNNPEANVLVRVIAFSDAAYWHVSDPTPVNDFSWDKPLEANGLTAMGKAMSLLEEQLNVLMKTTKKLIPPVFVLVSDGEPTDDYNYHLKKLLDNPIAKKAVRISIAVGSEADKEELAKFLSSGARELGVIEVNNPERLIEVMKWVSTLVGVVSDPKNMGENIDNGSLPDDDGDEIW